ncbi:ATP-grasp domain-containing protein [Streptomyces microflavus]|uniref:ATP-grasp domain-containing protein n=1 Tax=Streptomyces microflavus TaxID=1919 RepID=UPI0029AE860B|nr:ATP-grasp domain-containing protein [Streptomyces microflavus]MDX2405279.1 ATP-grasp domain-containing protein [Streptomyces microflavus]
MTDVPDVPRTLVLPPRLTASARKLRDAAVRRGLHVVESAGFSVPELSRAPQGRAVHLHAGPSFADAVAPALGISPLEAPADWLARLPYAFTRREIRALPIGEAYLLRRPAFIKSPNDKSISALVYADGSRLPGPDAVDPKTVVLVSDVMTFAAEYRLHLLDGTVHTGSQYAAEGRLRLGPPAPGALAFGRDLLAAARQTLPSAIVVDVGVDDDGRWAVVEANAAWGSGCYEADPDRALDTVLRAAGPVTELFAYDRDFVRRPLREDLPQP